jgi:hypothetical protein
MRRVAEPALALSMAPTGFVGLRTDAEGASGEAESAYGRGGPPDHKKPRGKGMVRKIGTSRRSIREPDGLHSHGRAAGPPKSHPAFACRKPFWGFGGSVALGGRKRLTRKTRAPCAPMWGRRFRLSTRRSRRLRPRVTDGAIPHRPVTNAKIVGTACGIDDRTGGMSDILRG